MVSWAIYPISEKDESCDFIAANIRSAGRQVFSPKKQPKEAGCGILIFGAVRLVAWGEQRRDPHSLGRQAAVTKPFGRIQAASSACGISCQIDESRQSGFTVFGIGGTGRAPSRNASAAESSLDFHGAADGARAPGWSRATL